jgi:tetratricopeptide (TPR) repeat protein
MLVAHSLLINPIALFISHAQADVAWCKRLKRHLAFWRRQGVIVNCSCDQVALLKISDAKVAYTSNNAHIIVLLISPAYIDSDQCYEGEMVWALQRQREGKAQVIPVRLDAITDWRNTPFEELQSLPADGRPVKRSSGSEKALFDVAQGIVSIIKTVLDQQQQDRPAGYCPIIGQPPSSHRDTIVQRAELVRLIYEKLTSPDISALVLTGIGGIGKSTLAALLYGYAEQQRMTGSGTWTGKTLWLNIDATVTLADILGTLREGLNQPALNLASLSTENMVYELSKTLQSTEQPCLIILDQFEELLDPQTGQARVPHSGINQWLDAMNTEVSPSRLLLTSRFSPRGTGLSPARFLQEYTVSPLTLEEGRALLHTWGIEVPEAEAHQAVEECHGHSLALVLLSRLLLNDPSATLRTFFEHPWYAQQRADTMGEALLNHMFFHQLNQDQRDLLSAFALYREAVPVEAAQAVVEALSNMPIARSASAHRVLLSQQLLLSVGKRLYQSHSLIAEFAQQQIGGNNEQLRQTLLRRAHTQAACYYRRQAMRDKPLRKQWQGLERLHPFIEAVWHFCRAKRQRDAYNLMVQENIFFDLQRWGNNSVLLELYQDLEPSKYWKPSPAAAARIWNEIGEMHSVLGKWHMAEDYFKRALDSLRAVDEHGNRVKVLNNLGTAYRQQGQIQEALACYQEAKRLSENAEDPITSFGITLNNLGYAYAALARQEQQQRHRDQERLYYQQALECYQQALPLHRSAENFIEAARTLNNIGETYQALRQGATAYTYHQQALALAREQEDRWIEATALNDLGILAKRWQLTKISTLECYKQSLAIFRAVGAREDERTVLKNLGYWYLLQKQYDVTLGFFVLARNIPNETHDASGDAIPQTVIGELRLALGEQGLQALQDDIEKRAEQVTEEVLQA